MVSRLSAIIVQRLRSQATRFSTMLNEKADQVDVQQLIEWKDWVLKRLPREEDMYLVLLVAMAHFRFSLWWTVIFWFASDGQRAIGLAFKLISARSRIPWTPKTSDAFRTNPDVETVGWLNKLINCFWTESISGPRGLMSDEGMKVINRKMQDCFGYYLPGWVAKLLRPLKIEKLDLGMTAPWLTGISVYTNSFATREQVSKELLLDVGLVAHLLPNIKIRLNKYLTFGVEGNHSASFLFFRHVLLLCFDVKSFPFFFQSQHKLNCVWV